MKKLALPIVLLLWLAAACGGLGAIARYNHRAGPGAVTQPQWPSHSTLTFDHTRFNLVLALHPQCSCSKATLSELERILSRSGERLTVYALVVLPENAPASWRESDIVAQLNALPNTQILFDQNGAESLRFGASTSGHALLFSPEGTRLFHGGITESRGHIGENAGEQNVLDLIQRKPALCEETPVYGCKLHNTVEAQQ